MHYLKLEVWQRGYQVSLGACKLLQSCRDFALKDQISRSAISIPSNIAEGSERRTAKDNVKFLYIAKGSCGELVTQLMFARDLGYISEATANEMIDELIEVSRMIGGLIRYRSSQIQEKRGEYRGE
ncbi:four helix bundle protein [Photobacterium proteolyticum]|uniref:Four helix bundle protein n=1 Tax=Photobacterium proteolyticum TaxID=1903952 RepID=A0A1Q9GN69_9GAMM|nr:four helix bundle protein [Photobacterium proteolyticum]OLQ76104.1 four helix bundle protein [Photobacterium proteolyticum]